MATDYKVTRFYDVSGTDIKINEKWRIVTSAPYSPPRILALSALPALNSFFFDPSTETINTSWKVTNRDIGFVGNDNRIWEVGVEYTNVAYLQPKKRKNPNIEPWTDKSVVVLQSRVAKAKAMYRAYARASLSGNTFTYYNNNGAVITAIPAGLPSVDVRNSAGDYYSPVPEVEEGGVVLNITTNVRETPTFDPLAYAFTLNSIPVTYGPWTITALYGKIESIEVSPAEWSKQSETGSTTTYGYYVVKFSVSVDQFPQLLGIPDRGYNALFLYSDGGSGFTVKREPIKVNGRRPSAPELLNGEGGWPGVVENNPLAANPVIRYYLGNKLSDWAGLPYRAS